MMDISNLWYKFIDKRVRISEDYFEKIIEIEITALRTEFKLKNKKLESRIEELEALLKKPHIKL
jgi:hypothetical protein